MSSDVCYEVGLKTRSQKQCTTELLAPIITSFGYAPEQLIYHQDYPYEIISLYESSQARAKALLTKLEKIDLKQIQPFFKKHKQQEWLNAWKDQWDIFALTQFIDVVPIWKKSEYQHTKRTPIFLDANGAFGTGLHETTQFMAEFIEDKNGKFQSFFDVGVGTGILSGAAKIHGASYIAGIDLSKDIIKVAKENFTFNNWQFDQLWAMDFKDFKSRQTFDFVAANLISVDLMAFAKKIVRFVKPNGYLAISGISLRYLNDVKKVFKAFPLQCLKIKQGQKWAAILFKRRSEC